MDSTIQEIVGWLWKWLGAPIGIAIITWFIATARATRQVKDVKVELELIRKDLTKLETEIANMKKLLESAKDRGGDELAAFISEWNDKWTEVMRSLGKLEGQLQSLGKLR